MHDASMANCHSERLTLQIYSHENVGIDKNFTNQLLSTCLLEDGGNIEISRSHICFLYFFFMSTTE